MFTLKDYAMGREKLYPNSWTEIVKNNAIELLRRVNPFLEFIGFAAAVLSSGWRPHVLNMKMGGRRKSNHVIGAAIDILDRDKKLAAYFYALAGTNPINDSPEVNALLEKFDLYMEHPAYTIGWIHVQTIAPASGKRVFIP